MARLGLSIGLDDDEKEEGGLTPLAKSVVRETRRTQTASPVSAPVASAAGTATTAAPAAAAAPSLSSLFSHLETQTPAPAAGGQAASGAPALSGLFSHLGGATETPVQAAPKAKKDDGDAGRGFSAALNQTPALLKGAVGFVGAAAEKAVGEGGMATALKKYGLEGYQKGMAEIADKAKDTDDVTVAWEKAKGGDLGALVDWAQYGIGYLGGNIAETLGTALLGGVVGTAFAPGAGTVAGAATGVAGKQAVKGAAKSLIEAAVAKEAAKLAQKAGAEVATDAMVKQATKTVAKNIGKTGALVGSGITKGVGGIYGEAVDEAGTDRLSGGDLARIFGAGVVAGLSEAVVDKLGLDAAAGKIKIPGGGRVGRSIVGGAVGTGIEGGTELLQTAIERFGAAKALTGEDAMRDYINAFALGGLGGGTIGGVLGAMRRGEADSSRVAEILNQAQNDLTSDSGRQELFDAMFNDDKMRVILQSNGIESGDDPRFQSVITKALATQRLLADLEAPTPEQMAETRKTRQADLDAAFGQTASTGTGVGTGATEPVIQRSSVTPNEETRTLDGEAKPVILPEGKNTPAGTVAMSPEDLAARKEGFEVMPAFTVGGEAIANRFVTAQQAETFLFGTKDKKTGQRTGGYASSVDDMEFRVRKGKRSAEAGGGFFYFVEGKERPAKPNRNLPSTTVIPPKAGPTPETQTSSRAAPGGPAERLVDRGDGVMVPSSQIPKISDIDAKANEAATSPLNALPQPTDGQKAAGNYKKGQIKLLGLDIAVENPKGSERSGTDASGKAWRQNMQHHYGYVKGSRGNDKDQVDVFIGPNPESGKVFVVDQVNPDGSFDEHKAMLGFDSAEAARAGYLANYEPGWQGLGAISEMPAEAFKSWVKDGQKKRPLALPAPSANTDVSPASTQQDAQTEQSVPGASAESQQTSSVPGANLPKADRPKRKRTGGDRLKSATYERNPFLAFIGKHGINLSLRKEFSPDARPMISGYGPMFRRSGLQLDELTIRAIEDGYLPRDADSDDRAIYEMIQALMSGTRIDPVYGFDADTILEDRFAEESERRRDIEAEPDTLTEDDDGYAAAEREAIQAVDQLTDTELFDLDEAIAFGGESNISTADAMRALGFTEQEIQSELAREAKEAESRQGAGKAAAQEEGGSDPQGDGEARADAQSEVKQTVEQKLKAKAKKAKATKVEPMAAESVRKRTAEERKADRQIGKNKVSKAEVIETWEDNDDGKSPHVAWSSLPADVQQEFFEAAQDGYANIELHDRLVNRVLQNARADRINAKVQRPVDDDEGTFRLASGKGGMPVERLKAIVEAFRQNWANMPEVVVVASEKDLPAKLYGQVQRDKAEGLVSGAYWKGKVYLVARNISDLPDAVVTVNHEVAGHFGLRATLGAAHADTMRAIYAGHAEVRKAADQMMVKEGLDLETAVEEVLADFAESGKYPENVRQSVLKQIYTALRKVLRDVFKVAYVSDAELREIVANARRYVEQGGQQGEGGTKAADASMVAARATARANTPVFYSALERAFRANKTERMPAAQWKSWLASKSKDLGVKKEEIEWVGVNEWLDLKGNERITKQELLDWVAGNRVYVNEVVLRDDQYATPSDIQETFEYTEPSESDLREFVREQQESMAGDMDPDDADSMPSPDDMNQLELREWVAENYGWQNYMQMHRRQMARFQQGRVKKQTRPRHTSGSLVLPGGTRHAELVLFDPTVGEYKPTDDIHYGDLTKGKTIGWLRMNVRKDLDGNSVLFLEELQSQRGQDGRDRGFGDQMQPSRIEVVPDGPGWVVMQDGVAAFASVNRERVDAKADELRMQQTPGVPDAPFVKNTQSWTSLLLKRAIAYAQQQGINRIAWTRGEQQNERYAFPGDQLVYVKQKGKDEVTLTIMRGGRDIRTVDVPSSQIASWVGKGIAEKIESNEGQLLDNENETSGVIEGEDLKLAAVNLSPYYDQTVPSVAKTILKQFGGTTEIMQIEGTGQQIGFVIPESLQKQVEEDGLPMFRRKDYESQFDDLDPKTRQMALDKGQPTPPTIRERLDALRPKMWLRVVQGMFDPFRPVRDIDNKAYMKLRMSSGPQAGAVSGLLHYGQVFDDDGALNLKKGTKGLIEILQPVGKETDRFLLWVAANRAGNLAKEEREFYFKPDEITALKKLNLGTMPDGRSRAGVYAQTLQQMNELNRSVLDVSKAAGLIDEAAYKKFAADIWYVPFYRQMDDDRTLSAAQTSSGSVGQYMSKTLKGSERPLNDLMENVLLNWSHILSASMKNKAANATLDAAMQMGGVVRKLDKAEKGSVKTMVNGKEQHWMIEDEFLFAALDGVANMPDHSWFTKMAREFKTILTRTISLSPTFKINNLIRDSIQSIGLSELDKNPMSNVLQGYRAYKDERAEALIGGGLFAMGNAYDGDQATMVKKLIKSGASKDDILTTADQAKEWFSKALEKYDEVSDAMENANRLALYNQLRAKGATHLEAAYAARDLQDFSLQGSWGAVRWAAQVLPYFNARMQGLYKLGRDGADPIIAVMSGKATDSQRQKAAKFGTVLAGVVAVELILYLSQMDDEDWKKREEWEKDAFWWFKVPGTDKAVRIPKPFEMGAIGTIIGRATEQMVDSEVEGKVFAKRLLSILADNFAINPIPQIVRPIADLSANKDGFTDRPIESMGMERVSKENRINAGTSAAAVGMNKINGLFADFASAATGGALNAENMQLSPIQYDYLLRGYLGWVGTIIQTASNMAVTPFKDGESSRYERIDDFLVVGNYVRTATPSQSRWVTSFYENAKDMATLAADMQSYRQAGEIEKAVKLAEEKGDKLALNALYTRTQTRMADLNKRIKMVEADAEMDGAEKRTMIESLQQVRIELARNAEQARIAAGRERKE